MEQNTIRSSSHGRFKHSWFTDQAVKTGTAAPENGERHSLGTRAMGSSPITLGSSDKDRAQELNREVCVEIFAAVAALGNRQIFTLGDWNFEPDNFPIDLLNGGQVNRPLSEVRHTSPVGELQIDWILCSKALLPACGMEKDTGKKPDHVAISLDFRLDLKSYETAERTTEQEVGVEYGKARQAHLTRWSTALASHDVDHLWELWCRAAEQALGLPANSRGRLLLGNQQLLEKVPDDEAVEAAKQQDTVVNLKRKLLDTGACTVPRGDTTYS
eukprot:2067284-Amphidinium_carterae.1